MATAKTSAFWLTETVELTVLDGRVQGTLDLGAYVDIGSSTSVAILECDFILQARDTVNNVFSNSLPAAATGNTQWSIQVMDLNPGPGHVSGFVHKFGETSRRKVRRQRFPIRSRPVHWLRTGGKSFLCDDR